jgi:hypothetical protein
MIDRCLEIIRNDLSGVEIVLVRESWELVFELADKEIDERESTERMGHLKKFEKVNANGRAWISRKIFERISRGKVSKSENKEKSET